MKSLRGQVTFFAVFLLTVCIGLASVMLVLFRESAGAQIEQVQAATEGACTTLSTRYARSLADARQAAPQVDLLQVLLQLVLLERPHVEGGVWRSGSGFLAYAYPTYEGSGVKRDIPDAEADHIVEIARVAARTQRLQTDVVRAAREALLVTACPLVSPDRSAVAWTMSRAPVGTLSAQRSLVVGLGVLLAFVLCSGLWLARFLVRASRHLERLEAGLAAADTGAPSAPLPRTGVVELDRIVGALDRYRASSDLARDRLREAERRNARDQRLAALGRMTGGVAHEIRNPIAAMRLKAENALAGPADAQSAALELVLGQIGRLDDLVTRLLAVVQPLGLQRRPTALDAWLGERLDAVRARAGERGIALHARTEPMTAAIDPVHLARAVDNLLDNAVRHARAEVVATLARGADGAVLLRVDDDGDGVDAAIEGQLFEPFATGRPDGTGLGLTLAREVALAHGGDLVHRARPGGGTRFEMELPWHAS